jgi:hypothetical protein
LLNYVAAVVTKLMYSDDYQTPRRNLPLEARSQQEQLHHTHITGTSSST